MTKISSEKRNDPRLNIAFYDEHLAFCKAMAWKKHQNVTQYINELIAKEMAKHDRTEWDNSTSNKNL